MVQVYSVSNLHFPSVENTSTLSAISENNNRKPDSHRNRLVKSEDNQNVSPVYRNGIILSSFAMPIQNLLRIKKKNAVEVFKENEMNEPNEWDDLFEQEKLQHEWTAKEREDTFNAIVCNEPLSVPWKKFFCHIIGTVCISAACTTPSSLIPVHNILEQPEYWYEVMIPLLPVIMINCLYIPSSCSYYINIEYIKNARFLFKLFMFESIFSNAIIISFYLIWTHVFGYQFPVPYWGYLTVFVMVGSILVAIWLRYPLSWRRNLSFRRRVRFTHWNAFHGISTPIQYNTLAKVLSVFKNTYQPLIALFFPVLKKCNIWIGGKLTENSSLGDTSGSKIVNACIVVSRHTIQVCYIVGSITTDVTTWVLIGTNFFMNFYTCLKIVWTKRRNPEAIGRLSSMLQRLALSEIIEFMAPLSFMISFLVAYQGPNSTLIGNVGSSAFHYKKVEDIGNTVKNMVFFFIVDCSSIITNGVILWLTCKINFCKAIAALQLEFGSIICLIISFFGMVVSSISNSSF